MNILVTGVLGFVGFNISKYFLKIKNVNVIGIDNLDKTLYPIVEKKNRLKDLKKVLILIFAILIFVIIKN